MNKKNLTEIMARTKLKALVLRKETLRRLDPALLAEVRGGVEEASPSEALSNRTTKI